MENGVMIFYLKHVQIVKILEASYSTNFPVS
jgi:hypothetical protein